MKNKQLQNIINKAILLENKKYMLELFMCSKKKYRYMKIAKLYNEAGQIAKSTDKENAINFFKRVLYYNLKIYGHNHSIDETNILLNIAELYIKINYTKSIEYYGKIANYYLSNGNKVKYDEIVKDMNSIHVSTITDVGYRCNYKSTSCSCWTSWDQAYTCHKCKKIKKYDIQLNKKINKIII